MRLVLDTNVVASAALSGGMPRLLLQAAREKRIDIFTSMPLLAELSEILGRSKFSRKLLRPGSLSTSWSNATQRSPWSCGQRRRLESRPIPMMMW